MSHPRKKLRPIDELLAAYANLERVLRRRVRGLSSSDLRLITQLHLNLDAELLTGEDRRRLFAAAEDSTKDE